MRMSLDKLLRVFKDMESFENNDRLGLIIKTELSDELDEGRLDLISAACKPKIHDFWDYLKKMGHK